MDPLMHSISPVSAAAVGALISAIWQGTALAAIMVMCFRLTPGLSAAARSAIWLNVFTLLVLLHVLPAFTEHGTNGSLGHFSPVYLDLRWCVPIALTWAALSLMKGAQLVLSAVRLHRIARRATPISPEPALQALLQNREGNKSAGRSAELCTSTEVVRPSVFGFLRPRILVPPELIERLSGEELRLVIQHEMEHLRRADDWTNLLQKIALVLFPLNPVLHWVERRLCCERELACDDRVLRSSAGRKDYAICLTRLAEYSMVHRGLSLVLGAWERQSELVRRVDRILSRPGKSMSRKAALTASAALIVGALGCAVVLSRSPQLVSFSAFPQSALMAQAVPPKADLEMNLREMGGAPRLVKAVMPQRPTRAPIKSRPAPSSALKRDVKPQPVPSQEAWVVLTEWSSTEVPPQIVIAVQRDTRPSYAAVQFANGWLIVQI
jgi:beta-lactamase regulating signal transducer with metallopeptidase domain